ncbi:hypothetical protein NX059_006349 [Plenodomus lindquistii]|nr:hypothetical protein NX059_006349 [Plenodomus lindquistii]
MSDTKPTLKTSKTGLPLTYNFIFMNTPSHLEHGLWRMPSSRTKEYTTLDLWVELAKLAEETKIDMIFFADILGMYDAPNWKDVPKHAVQFPSCDPMALMGTLAYVTKHLGLIYTSSVFAAQPYMFARQISTLDHLSKGRMGWNVVTGSTSNGAKCLGLPELKDHAARYAWADEYIDVTYKLWEGSHDVGSVVRDGKNNIYSDPKKVHKINHKSEHYSVEGPHTVEPSPQRAPVIFQAGASGPGIEFAGKHAEGCFLISGTPEAAKKKIEQITAAAKAAGRNPDDMHFIEGITPIVGKTLEEAQAKQEEYNDNLDVTAHHLQFSGATGLDLSAYPPDTPLEDLLPLAHGMQGPLTITIDTIKDRKATIRDLAANSIRIMRYCGTPAMIADRFEEYIEAGITGFNLISATVPGTVHDFVELVAPELKRRGLMKTEYSPGTLREKMFPKSRPEVNERHPAAKYRGFYKEDE